MPSKEQLRAVIMHLPIQGKALFLTLLSSGMRIGEALKLRVGDLDFSSDPVAVHVKAEYTKMGEKRITFISKEAKEAVQEWLKVKDQYVMAAVGKSHLYKNKLKMKDCFPLQA